MYSISAVFRRFLKGARLRFPEIGGGQAWMQNLLSDLGWPFQGVREYSRGANAPPPCAPLKPSNSPWASPIVLVRKKDGGLCICVNYHSLNTVTKADRFPCPGF